MAIKTVTAEIRQNALALAYGVLTDKRNLSRYSTTGVVSLEDENDFLSYSDMLDVLKELYKEAVEAQKEEKA